MADKKINIGLGFNVDKTNLNTLKTELQSLLNMSTDDLIKIGSENAVADLKEIQTAASAVQSALEKSFNPKLNTQDLTKFQQELAMSGQSISSIKAGLDKAGASGQNAFRNITAELLTTNRQLKQSNEWLDRMADTMANTVRWTVASSALNAVTGSIQKAYSFTKQLDTSLNDIRIVTGKSADEMARFAKEATTAAKNLGSTTTAYTKAALIYEQQGLGEADVTARSDVTTKVSNVTGQSAADVSEQLTAIWNGYKVSAAEAELYIDKVSAVAATTAADLEELSEGMGKVASAANSMGVDIDQLNASLATIISVTRQDASAVGTSLKTIYARMGDLAVDGEDEFGVKLGDVSGKLKTMGVDILDAQGQMREMGEVIEEVAEKWDTWTSAQQQAAAVALAGKRQYNNLIALFENWDMYEEAKSTSKGGAGELQKQQDIYMESMEAHLNRLQAEAEELYQTLLDPEGLNPLIDALTGVVGLVENLIESLGGGAGLLRTVGAIGFNVFGKQITKGITSTINNVTGFKDNLKQAAAEAQIIKELELTNTEDKRQQEILNIAKQRLAIAESMTEEEYNASNVILKRTNELYKQQDSLEEQKKTIESFIGTLAQYNEKGELVNAEEVGIRFESIRGELGNDATVAGNASEEAGLSRQLFGKRERIASVENYLNSEENYSNQEKYNEKYAEYLALLQQESELQERIVSTKADGAIESTIGTLAEYITASEEGNSKIELTVDKQNELKHILDIVSKAYDKNGQCIAENIDEVIDAEKALKKFEKILDEANKTAKIASKDVDKLGKSEKKLAVELEESEAALGKLKKAFDLTKTVENVTKLAGGFTNLAAGIETIKGLGDIWTDDNLTGGEKFLQTVTAIGFGLPQVVSGMSGMFQGIKGLTEAYQNFNTAKTAAIALNKAMQAGEITEATLTSALALAKSKLTKEEYEKLVAQLAGTEVQKKAAQETLKSIVSDNAKSFSLMGLAGAAKTAGAAIKTATTAFLTSPIGWIVLAVTTAIAATASLIHLIKAYNTTDEEAFNNAKQRQNELSQALQETKQKYDDLKNSIEDYKNARNSLDELTAGTTAWKEALADANSQALALLQTYPELAKYIHKDENGLITIAEEGLNALADKQLNDVYKVQTASLIGGVIARDAKDELDTSNRSKDFGVNEKTLDAILKLESDTILNPEKFASSLKSESIGIKDGELINSLNENREEIFALKQTVDTTNHLLAVESGEIVGNMLNRYGYGADSGILGGIITSNMLAEGDQQEAIDKLKESINISSGAFDAWAYAMGIDADAGSFKNDTWNAQVKYTVDGEEKTISYDQFKKELATHRYYYENTQQYLDNATELLAKVGKTTTTETNNIIRSVFASNQAVTKDSIEDFTWATAEEIKKVQTEQAKSLTESQYNALETTYNNLTNSLTNMASERGWFDTDDAGNTIQNALVSIFGATDWDALIHDSEISHALLAGGGDALSRISAMEGQQGLDAITKFLSTIDDPGAFLSGIDWSSETLGADIVQRMHEFNMEVDYTNETTSKAIMYFSQLNGVLETTAERAANTKKIIDGLDYGSVISKEDFDYLRTNYGDLIDSYFTQMEDGTAVLIASAWDFYDAYHTLDKARREAALKEAVEDYQNFDKNKDNFLSGYSFTPNATTVKRDAEREDYIRNTSTLYFNNGNSATMTIDRDGNIIDAYSASMYYDGLESDLEYYLGVGSAEMGIMTQEQIMPMVKEWLKTDAASEYRNRILSSFNVKSLDDLKSLDWYDIIVDQGLLGEGYFEGGDIKLNTDNNFWTAGESINVPAMITDIITQRAKAKYADTVAYTVNQSDILSVIQAALTAGVISEEAKKEHIDPYIGENSQFQATSNDWKTAPIYEKIQKAIKATNNSTENVQKQLEGLLSTAASPEEYEQIRNDQTELYGDIFGDKWKGIVDSAEAVAKPRAQINFEQTAVKKYETSVSNVDEAYQNLNETIESLNKQLDNIFGQERINLLNQINDAIDRQNSLLLVQNQLTQNEINRQLIDENSEVSKAFDKVGGFSTILTQLGIEDDGVLTADEYDQIINKLLNSDDGSLTDPINTIITNLGPLFDTITTNSNSILDNNLQKNENALDAFDTKFREAHERNEIAKSYNDFMKDFSLEEDDYFSQSEYATDNYTLAHDDVEKSMQKIKELADATYDSEKETYEINGETLTLEEMRTAILEEGTNLQEYALSLKESLTDLQELEMAQIEEIAEQYDNIVGYAESWNEFLEHGLALQELIHGENYEATKSWYEAQAAAVQSQLDTQKSEYVYWKTIVAEIEAGTRSDYTYDEAREKMLESGKEVAATSAELGQMLYDNFERAWNSHFAGFERAKSEYEWISSQAERAFDTITGALESQKLINDWTKTMNETLDENAQKQMKDFIDLQEEKLKNLRTEGKLSQYNLDLAQAEFDLLQAKIALEDARNNKTQMRLTRGADGSYSYQYVADDQAIAQAESQVSEAAKNRLEIVKEEMDNQVNNFYDDVSALQNLLLEYTPDGISVEEKTKLNERVKDIKLNLFDKTGNIRLEDDLKEAVKAAAEAAGIKGYENRELEDLITDFPEFQGYLDIINSIGSLDKILEEGITSVNGKDGQIGLIERLGLLNIGTHSGEDGTLMGEIKDLLAGLTADELAGLGESIDGLEKISKAAEEAEKSFNDFAKSIKNVAESLKELGTATSADEWSKIIHGDEETGKLGLADLSSITENTPEEKSVLTKDFIEIIDSSVVEPLANTASLIKDGLEAGANALISAFSNIGTNISNWFKPLENLNKETPSTQIGTLNVPITTTATAEEVERTVYSVIMGTDQFINTANRPLSTLK